MAKQKTSSTTKHEVALQMIDSSLLIRTFASPPLPHLRKLRQNQRQRPFHHDMLPDLALILPHLLLQRLPEAHADVAVRVREIVRVLLVEGVQGGEGVEVAEEAVPGRLGAQDDGARGGEGGVVGA